VRKVIPTTTLTKQTCPGNFDFLVNENNLHWTIWNK